VTQQDRNKRRALIVRRWAAHRVGRAQREIWRQRRRAARAADSEDLDDVEVVGEGDLLADLPEALIG
jgi:hypothetical protein